jgi:hypothetical protein
MSTSGIPLCKAPAARAATFSGLDTWLVEAMDLLSKTPGFRLVAPLNWNFAFACPASVLALFFLPAHPVSRHGTPDRRKKATKVTDIMKAPRRSTVGTRLGFACKLECLLSSQKIVMLHQQITEAIVY